MIYTVEHSVKQQCFHISDLDTILKTNIRNTIQNEVVNDYKIIALKRSYEEAEEFIKEIKKKMKIYKGSEYNEM